MTQDILRRVEKVKVYQDFIDSLETPEDSIESEVIEEIKAFILTQLSGLMGGETEPVQVSQFSETQKRVLESITPQHLEILNYLLRQVNGDKPSQPTKQPEQKPHREGLERAYKPEDLKEVPEPEPPETEEVAEMKAKAFEPVAQKKNLPKTDKKKEKRKRQLFKRKGSQGDSGEVGSPKIQSPEEGAVGGIPQDGSVVKTASGEYIISWSKEIRPGDKTFEHDGFLWTLRKSKVQSFDIADIPDVPVDTPKKPKAQLQKSNGPGYIPFPTTNQEFEIALSMLSSKQAEKAQRMGLDRPSRNNIEELMDRSFANSGVKL